MCPDGFISWLATIFFSRALEIRSVVIVCIEHHYVYNMWFGSVGYYKSYFQFLWTKIQYWDGDFTIRQLQFMCVAPLGSDYFDGIKVECRV